MKVLGVVPARGGSKGLPRKNIRLLAGKPLIAHTLQAALPVCDRVIVSTDDEEIASVARGFGGEVPFLRPAELSTDQAPTAPVIVHAVNYIQKHENWSPDVVVILQPTSPLRLTEDIRGAVKQLVETGSNSVISLCRVEHSPYWMKLLDEEGRLLPLLPDVPANTRRQDLPTVFRPNGAVYAIRTPLLMTGALYDETSRGYVMPEERSIDIDTEFDFLLAELMLQRGIVL